MRKMFKRLSQEEFDVVVTGAGIYGACIAEQLARAGYKTALIEARDFGSKTSAHSAGILYGGPTAMQRFDFKRLRRCTESTRYFLALAPQLVQIVAVNLPLKRWALKNALVMRLVLALNDATTSGRNLGLPSRVHMPKSSLIPKKSLAKDSLLIADPKVVAVARWYEAVITNPARLVLEVVLSAQRHGCVAVNYCKVQRLNIDKGQLTSVEVIDRLSNTHYTLRTRWLIDASGRNGGKLNTHRKQPRAQFKWARANNIVINRRIGAQALAFFEGDQAVDPKLTLRSDERQLCAMPIGERTVIGTFYSHQDSVDGRLKPSKEDKQHLLKRINQAYPRLNIRLDEVIQWHSGWLPLRPGSSVAAMPLQAHLSIQLQLSKHTHTDLHTLAKIPARRGIIEVSGVKFTTAPAAAQDVLSILQPHHQPPRGSAKAADKLSTDLTTKPAQPKGEFEQVLAEKYGPHWAHAKDYFAGHPSYPKPLHNKTLMGEIAYAVDHEHAQRLEDVLRRRTSLNENGPISKSIALQVLKIMQAKLSWSTRRAKLELAQARILGLISA